jgi:alpha,alpha-trehalase
MPSTKLFFIESLGELYTDIQSSEIFSDSKYFVDGIPKYSSEEILSKYETEKNKNNFSLLNFIESNFILPVETITEYTSDNKPIEQHLHELWNVLERKPSNAGGTIIPLPYPYIVPGGRFREIYYWDSYFTMLGLQVDKRIDIIENMIDNFAYLIDTVGFIPNGNRTYYLGRSQPPFFSLMVSLLSEEKGIDILLKYQSALEKEYAYWMDGEKLLTSTNNQYRRVVLLDDGDILNRYWDDHNTPRPEAFIEDVHVAEKSKQEKQILYRHIRAAAESGWDFSSRWFKDEKNMHTIQTTDLIPVDLNCLLLHAEQILLKIYSIQNNATLFQSFEKKIEHRKKAIEKYCWNEPLGFYFDYHHKEKKQTRTYSLAATYPLFVKIATQLQADKVAHIIEENFLHIGGVITTMKKNNQQWDAPNGWAPLQWTTYKSLKDYHHVALAKEIKKRWMLNNETKYATSGKMMEKYNVMDINSNAGDGEYPNQDGFGWTNGVYLKMNNE